MSRKSSSASSAPPSPAVVHRFAAGHRSLGTHAILWHVGRAAELGLPYVYLDHWIEDCRKMACNARLAPLELGPAGDDG